MGETLKDLDDKELYELIEKANLADRLESDPAWKMLKEAAERIVDKAIAEFALKVKPDDLVKIIELKMIIRKYRFGLFEEVKILKQESEFAYQEAKERGVFGDFFDNIKKAVGVG